MSGCTGLIGEPHFVQNLSLGRASLPHEEQVQPVRRKREIRELKLSPASAGAGETGMGAAGCCAGYAGQGAAACWAGVTGGRGAGGGKGTGDPWGAGGTTGAGGAGACWTAAARLAS